MRRWALGLLCAATLGLSCRGGQARFPGAPVVLISIDTLRSDHLPAYGYRDVETPHLDRFRADSILFRQAYSPCPMTLPAHVTIAWAPAVQQRGYARSGACECRIQYKDTACREEGKQ